MPTQSREHGRQLLLARSGVWALRRSLHFATALTIMVPHVEPRGAAMGAQDFEAGMEIGDFQIERRLGAGGMGVVYQARQKSLNRLVALKVLGAALSRPSDLIRFQREAQATARLHHRAIAEVHCVEQDSHVCYIAMEFIDGITLRQFMERVQQTHDSHTALDSYWRSGADHDPIAPVIRFDAQTALHSGSATRDGDDTAISDGDIHWSTRESQELIQSQQYIRRICEIIRDAALALAHAHEQSVIHRDIKPSNIMVDRSGGVHLIDFGVARFFEDISVTTTGQLVGTPMYMSPEQVTGRVAIDGRTDIYSLGLVLYELLALRQPIVASTREGVLKSIVTKAMFPITWRNKAVPRDLENIVHTAIAKDPDERYPTASDFAADLQRFLMSEPVLAPPYHYKFDEREIVAERPWTMTATAFWFTYVAVFYGLVWMPYRLGVAIADAAGSRPFPATPLERALFVIGYLVLAAAAVWVALGLLSGRAWARWSGIALAVVGLALSVAQPVQVIRNAWQYQNFGYLALMTVWLVTRLVMVCGGCFALYVLRLHEPAKQWFRFSEQIRTEHDQLATAIQTARWRLPNSGDSPTGA
jgi:serine/threonine protein kinase